MKWLFKKMVEGVLGKSIFSCAIFYLVTLFASVTAYFVGAYIFPHQDDWPLLFILIWGLSWSFIGLKNQRRNKKA